MPTFVKLNTMKNQEKFHAYITVFVGPDIILVQENEPKTHVEKNLI
jgi:hypothetical protein